MTDLVYLPEGKGWTRSVLDGNALRVRPEIFGAMQDILNTKDGEATELAVWALRRAGLTDDEINGRSFQNTEIVVDYDLEIIV